MKRITYLLIILFLVFLVGGCSKNNNDIGKTESNVGNPTTPENVNEVSVIILFGQSNAEGHTHSSMLQLTNTTLYNKYVSGNSKTKMIYHCDFGNNKSEVFKPVSLGMGFNSGRFGPEIGMTEVFDNTELKRDVYIIKYTVGGTNLYSQWRSPSSGSAGQLYDKMIMFIYEAMGLLENEGLIPYVKAVCFMQGEADSTNQTFTDAYQEYEDNLINDLNTDLSVYIEGANEVIKFIDAGISNCETWKRYEAINDAKMQNASKDEMNRAYIDTIGEGLSFRQEPFNGPDFFHYDSLSMIKLGELFAQEILDFNVLI